MKTLSDLFPKEFVEQRLKNYELKELRKKRTTYWDFLGELMYFGDFGAVQAVLSDYIELPQARMLLKGAKRAYYATKYDDAVTSLAGARGVYKGSEFDRLTKFYRDNM